MNWFTQHVPNFVDVDERPCRIPFETTEELLSIEAVKRYSQHSGFSHFAIGGNTLMEISDGGFRWWVVGFIHDPAAVELPQWDGGKYMAQLNDGTVVELAGSDVCSSCGGALTLRDGTVVKELRR